MSSSDYPASIGDTMIPNSDVLPTPDSITLLVCGQGHLASKQFSRNESGDIVKLGYNSGTHFGVTERTVAGIGALSMLLSAMEYLPNVFVIRGKLLNPPAPEKGIRRLNENFTTPETGRRWVLIDFDKIDLPDRLDLRENVHAVIEYLVSLLPPDFHDASYHYQLSSSAGMGDPHKASAHVWFWLSEPWPDAKLKAWGKAVNDRLGYSLVDTSLFQAVQAHYTAAPVFEGVENPFPARSGLVEKARDGVSIREITASLRPQKRSAGAVEPGPGFEGWLSRIGDHAGGEGFHEPIISAIASYVSTHGRQETDVEALYETVRAAVLSADGSRHSADEIADRASREHIIPAIEGALEKFGDQPTSRRRSRLVPGVAPAPRAESLDSKGAHEKLSNLLRRFISGGAA